DPRHVLRQRPGGLAADPVAGQRVRDGALQLVADQVAAGDVALGVDQFLRRYRLVGQALELLEELGNRRAGHLVAHVRAGLHAAAVARGRLVGAGAVGIALVLAQVLVDAAAEAAAQDRARQLQRDVVRIGRRDRRADQADRRD